MWATIYTRIDLSQDVIIHDTWNEAVTTARQFRNYNDVLRVEIYDPEGRLIATFTNYGSDKALL